MVPKCPQDSQEVNPLYISILYSRCVTGSPVSIIRTELSHDASQRKMMTLATARILLRFFVRPLCAHLGFQLAKLFGRSACVSCRLYMNLELHTS